MIIPISCQPLINGVHLGFHVVNQTMSPVNCTYSPVEVAVRTIFLAVFGSACIFKTISIYKDFKLASVAYFGGSVKIASHIKFLSPVLLPFAFTALTVSWMNIYIYSRC